MTIDQLSVFVENKPGKLVEAAETLSRAGIDLRAMSLADASDFGILRIIVDKPTLALKVMQDAGYLVQMSKVIPVSLSDSPGSLGGVLRILADAGIDVLYLYAFVAHKPGSAYVIIRVEDNEGAMSVLEKNGIKLVSGEEMYEM